MEEQRTTVCFRPHVPWGFFFSYPDLIFLDPPPQHHAGTRTRVKLALMPVFRPRHWKNFCHLLPNLTFRPGWKVKILGGLSINTSHEGRVSCLISSRLFSLPDNSSLRPSSLFDLGELSGPQFQTANMHCILINSCIVKSSTPNSVDGDDEKAAPSSCLPSHPLHSLSDSQAPTSSASVCMWLSLSLSSCFSVT